MDVHVFTVLAGSAICLALLATIARALLDLAGPILGRLYLERGLESLALEDLTAAEKRTHFARLTLQGLPARLLGVSMVLALLGAYRLTYQPQRYQEGKERRGIRRRLVLAYATGMGPYGDTEESMELFVEGPTISGECQQSFRFGVRRRLYDRTTKLEFHESADMALLDYYESVHLADITGPGHTSGAA